MGRRSQKAPRAWSGGEGGRHETAPWRQGGGGGVGGYLYREGGAGRGHSKGG